MNTIQPHSWCHVGDDNLTRVMLGSVNSVNIMAKVTYKYLYGTMPLEPTYAQLQMADQMFRFMEGLVKDVPI
jgi:hypothetical protein